MYLVSWQGDGPEYEVSTGEAATAWQLYRALRGYYGADEPSIKGVWVRVCRSDGLELDPRQGVGLPVKVDKDPIYLQHPKGWHRPPSEPGA